MKISPMRERMNLLREATNLKQIDTIELLLNNSKGTGTTNALIHLAKEKNLPIIVESEKVAEQLQEFHPEVKFHPFSKQLPGTLVLIDVSVMWVLLREAQKVRRLSQSLLDWMEHKQKDW